METIIEKIHARHEEWVFLVTKYGCNEQTAEDIVQEMYLRLIVYLRKTNADISYGDDVNIYFVAKTLKSIFLDQVRKQNRKPTVELKEEICEILDYQSKDYESIYAKVQEILGDLYWFDRKIYEIIESGERVASLADKTNIPYYTIYNTYKKVKNHIKNNI